MPGVFVQSNLGLGLGCFGNSVLGVRAWSGSPIAGQLGNTYMDGAAESMLTRRRLITQLGREDGAHKPIKLAQ